MTSNTFVNLNTFPLPRERELRTILLQFSSPSLLLLLLSLCLYINTYKYTVYAHQTFAVHIFLNILPVSLSLSLLYMATCRQLCLHKGAEQSSTLHVLFVSSFGVETRTVYILKYKYISHRQGYIYGYNGVQNSRLLYVCVSC